MYSNSMTSSTVVPPKKAVTPVKDSAVREVCHLYHITNYSKDAVKFGHFLWTNPVISIEVQEFSMTVKDLHQVQISTESYLV